MKLTNRHRKVRYIMMVAFVIVALAVLLLPSLVSNPQSVEASGVKANIQTQNVHINFEPSGVTVPGGYIADNGATYGSRGNGLTYGWSVKTTSDAYYRQAATSLDLRYATLIQMQRAGSLNASWKIAVANGTYQVHLVAGDAAYTNSTYRLNVNGKLVVNGTPTTSNHWVEGTSTVTVTNGRLIIANASGSSNNKIAFIDIVAVNKPTPTPTSTTTVKPTTTPVTTLTPTPTSTGGNGSLKNTFMLGIANAPEQLGWMTSSNIPWNMRYQYLCGGVNTSNDWTTWDSPNGAFATNYLNDSLSHGYLPVLTYYELLNSSPAVGSNENDQDFNNLNNAATMRAYYANFKLLMTEAGAFGKTVIVHIEPDLWGYLQERGTPPATTPAAVASSGFADVAGYPNTVVGFAQALVALRNKYAPNVLLGYHISPWASPIGDLGSDHETNFDTLGAAQQTAAYYLQLNTSFDLLFYDITDRDAAYYDSIGNPNTWWDVNNVTYPNFNRFNQFAAQITALTGKKGILWQVPLGNTKMTSMNNTNHHWQDNRVQYYLDSTNGFQHIKDLANSGIIAVLFGSGIESTTTNTDAAGDGVTNPAPINGNSQVATVSDDDGGYLRQQATSFYRNGGAAISTNLGSTSSQTSYVAKPNVSTSFKSSAITSSSKVATNKVPHLPRVVALPKSKK